ncbi:MBL fold metallo-hydrolase [Streptomyces sp. NPDC060002]|uniref:MBL fold metallo-hydrolase n=1 Tax=Streptomyces sp. NPDC060002 TaxID=3347033 RepID=UPI00368727D0
MDAGLPAHHGRPAAALDGIGRSVRDVRAVILTHAHLDHVGLAERLRHARHGAGVNVAGGIDLVGADLVLPGHGDPFHGPSPMPWHKLDTPRPDLAFPRFLTDAGRQREERRREGRATRDSGADCLPRTP